MGLLESKEFRQFVGRNGKFNDLPAGLVSGERECGTPHPYVATAFYDFILRCDSCGMILSYLLLH